MGSRLGVRSLPVHRRKSQQAEREYEKIKSQLEGLEESVRDRCKKEFTGAAAGHTGRGGARTGAWEAAAEGEASVALSPQT